MKNSLENTPLRSFYPNNIQRCFPENGTPVISLSLSLPAVGGTDPGLCRIGRYYRHLERIFLRRCLRCAPALSAPVSILVCSQLDFLSEEYLLVTWQVFRNESSRTFHDLWRLRDGTPLTRRELRRFSRWCRNSPRSTPSPSADIPYLS